MTETLKGKPLTEKVKKERIREEIGRLKKVKSQFDGDVYHTGAHLELVLITFERWLGYYNRDKENVIEGESDVRRAYRLTLLEGMGVDQNFSEVIEETGTKLVFRSTNFCPILEACKELGLETKKICKLIYEPSLDKIARVINPKMQFTRDYDKIRPDCKYCEETFFILP